MLLVSNFTYLLFDNEDEMDAYIVVKIKPEHLLGIAKDKVNESYKSLSRRKRRKEKKAYHRKLNILQDAEKAIKAREWIGKVEPFANHQMIANGVKVPFPLDIPYIEVDTGRTWKRRKPKVSKITYQTGPSPSDVGATPVDVLHTDVFRNWRRQEIKNQMIMAEVIASDT